MSDEPRVPLLPLDDAKARAAEAGVPDVAAELSVFRIWLQHPPLAKWFNDLIMGLLWEGRLDRRLRELVIMRLGWATGSVYEWTQHWRIATEFLHIDGDDLLAVRDWQSADRFGPAERAILAATDDVVSHGEIGDDAWAACRQHIGTDDVILLEIASVTAVWDMVSTVLRSLRVPLEDGVDPWPPDGAAPGGAAATG